MRGEVIVEGLGRILLCNENATLSKRQIPVN
jgi:hypothetical protein